MNSTIALQLLRREFEEIKLRNPSFSLRAYSKRLGLSSGALSEVLSGQRKLSLKQKLKLVDRLHLSAEERESFLSEEISSALQTKDRGYQHLPDDEFKVIADWWHFALLNLLNTKGFSSKMSWLGKRLGLAPDVIRDGWERLLRLGYIVKTPTGRLKRKSPRFSTSKDIINLSVRKAHIQDLGLIENALVHLPVELRTTSSITAPILVKDLEKAKKLIDEFQDRFMDIMESSEGDEVYRLSVSFFPLTQPEIKK